jgi:hypothetical protein
MGNKHHESYDMTEEEARKETQSWVENGGHVRKDHSHKDNDFDHLHLYDAAIKDKRKMIFKGGQVICLLIMLFVIGSCGPQSKESYMKKYDLFLEEVGKNREQYTDKDWKQKDEEYKQFSDKLYEKFKDDLTWKDELKLTANKAKYNYYLISKEVSFFKKLFDSLNVDEIESQIKFYMDNGMKEDIAALAREAKKVGKDAETVVNKILNDLKVNIKTDDD